MDAPGKLIEQLYRERILNARRMLPEDKLLAGARLFEYACEVTKAGIRDQFPEVDEETVQHILTERLALRRQLDAKGPEQDLKERGVEA